MAIHRLRLIWEFRYHVLLSKVSHYKFASSAFAFVCFEILEISKQTNAKGDETNYREGHFFVFIDCTMHWEVLGSCSRNLGKTALIYFVVTIYLGLRPRIKNETALKISGRYFTSKVDWNKSKKNRMNFTASFQFYSIFFW